LNNCGEENCNKDLKKVIVTKMPVAGFFKAAGTFVEEKSLRYNTHLGPNALIWQVDPNDDKPQWNKAVTISSQCQGPNSTYGIFKV
jgi:hypothetical protein